MSGTDVNEPVVNEPTVNEPRRSSFSLAASKRQAEEHGAPEHVIEAYQSELRTRRAERALRKVLADAPPLSTTQVAYLRAVVNEYGDES